jgi:membrane protein YdbS with pleckstrin-like domain
MQAGHDLCHRSDLSRLRERAAQRVARRRLQNVYRWLHWTRVTVVLLCGVTIGCVLASAPPWLTATPIGLGVVFELYARWLTWQMHQLEQDVAEEIGA